MNLAALVSSLLLTPMVADHFVLTWFLFFAFTAMHIYSNYRAVSCVIMETFNRLRFEKTFLNYISNVPLTPKEANKTEPLLMRKYTCYIIVMHVCVYLYHSFNLR